MSSFATLAWRSPVLYREIKQRMDNPRVIVVLTLYLVTLGGIVFAIYVARTGERTGGFNQPGVTEIAAIGQSLFEFVLFFMMLLVLFIVPGYTAPAIAGERERQTLMPLQVSMLRPRNIVIGKIASSVAFTLLLLTASLPLLAVAFLIGGITIEEVFVGLGIVLFTAVALACITVGCSALMKRVQGAIVIAYGVVLLLVGGTFVAFAVAGELDSSRGTDAANPTLWILAPNPLAAIADVAGGDDPQTTANFEFFGPPGFGPQSSDPGSPLSAIRDLMDPTENIGPFDGPIRLDRFGQPVFPDRPVEESGLALWARFGLVFSVAAIVSVVVATRSIRTPAHSER